MYLLGKAFPASPVIAVLVGVPVGAVVYGGAFLLVGGLETEEMRVLRGAVGRALGRGRP